MARQPRPRPRPRPRSPGLRELDAVELLASELSELRSTRVVHTGIGDDAAVISAADGRWVVSVDTSVEGVHFERGWSTLDRIGRRSFHAAASDLAAMGSTPVAALSSLHLPSGFSRRQLSSLARGQRVASEELACPIVGGNVSRAPVLSITTTVLGRCSRPLLRSGARPGDELWLLGDVGLASVGLVALQRGADRGRRSVAACVAAWRDCRARIDEGLALVGAARSCIDVSDGLVGDLRHLASASGVAVEVDESLLRASLSGALVAACSVLGIDPVHQALHGGEDYALVATGPAARRPTSACVIGRVRAGHGVCLRDARGRSQELVAQSYTHDV